MAPLLECRRISQVFGSGDLVEPVLRDVSVSFAAGETCVLLGPSGSGKTILLSVLGGLLTPSAGELLLQGERVDHRNRRSLMRFRRTRIGFIFQHPRLFPFLTVEENLRIVARNCGLSGGETTARINGLLRKLAIDDVRHKRPQQTSGGQRQRAAVARALLHRPSILLADEPIAALDRPNGRVVIDLLVEQARQQGALLITVLHDTLLLPVFDRTLRMESGQISEDLQR
jgi:putative ABC transport system ATP-binding protein